MQLTTTLSRDAVRNIVDSVAIKTYGGNIAAEVEHVGTRSRGARAGQHVYRVKLTARDSKGEGARRSWSGRRGPWTCWHAFRDVMAAWLLADPTAHIRTGVAVYDGARGFLSEFPATGDRNIGSMVQPVCMVDACDCEREAGDRTVSPDRDDDGRDIRDGERDYVAELEHATR